MAAVMTESRIGTRPAPSRRGRSWRHRLDTKGSPYLYIAPFFLVFAVFGLFPLVYTGYVSLTGWKADLPDSEHAQNTKHTFGDFDITALPENEKLRLTFGISFNNLHGAGGSTERFFSDEYAVSSQLKGDSIDFRVGGEGKILGFDWGVLQGYRNFNDRPFYFLNAPSQGNTLGTTLGAVVDAEEELSVVDVRGRLGQGLVGPACEPQVLSVGGFRLLLDMVASPEAVARRVILATQLIWRRSSEGGPTG